MIEKYYEEELRYLYESGREFAKAHPDRAQFLNVDAVGDRDPYVERLFEGFAFLAGRIREKLDDSFPELTEGLFNLMWPGLLHELPPVAIVQFKARTGLLQETRVLARGAELQSAGVGAEGAVCRFTTTSDVRLNPVSLANVKKTVDRKGKASLSFRFELDRGVQLAKLSLSPLRLYLHAEMPTALMLHEFLTRRAVSVSIIAGDGAAACDVDPKAALSPCGLSAEESILPQAPGVFSGYSLLLEYFAYPEKFLFVDLKGFENLPFTEESLGFVTFTVTFDSDFPADKPFSKENFRLFCAPAANIFKKDAEPVAVTGLETEYRVVADANYPASFHAHSIVSIEGVERATGKRSVYEPLYSFTMGGKKRPRTFATQYRYAPDGRRELFITPGGDRLGEQGEIREESLSIVAWCTNGVLPRETIREGGIVNPGVNFPDYVSFSNITRPTLPAMPPRNDDYLWMCISHLGSTCTTLSSPETLKALLRLYDWSHAEGRARRIEAITDASSKPVERIVNGSAVRGVEFSVSLAESEFSDTGDAHLFGQVLKEFLSQYVSVNTFLNLALVLKPSGQTLRWESLEGKKWLI
ncbi:MAG TPA: type VI secretion system baseplate subunit TssF [Chitinivibrionales bacterium]|nr:type VI secretion system baseplate subunit TssF [Chitinivibrionales bacterium]